MGKAPRDKPPEKYSEERPWGRFDRFVMNESCSVKVITVDPGGQLSLQSHRLRSEWWIVLDGNVEVELDGARESLGPGDEIFIPVGAKHRVTGLDRPCRWLEIIFGTFDEGDITRYEDIYGRKSQ